MATAATETPMEDVQATTPAPEAVQAPIDARTIRVALADGERFVEVSALLMSKTLAAMFDGQLDNTAALCAPLSDYNTAEFDTVIAYTRAAAGITPVPSTVAEYTSQLIGQLSATHLQLVFSVSNFLDIPSLTTLCAKTVAEVLKGKTPEEMRKILGAPDDLTPEQKAAIIAEYKWCQSR